ncbi:hypothetical protein SETIT_3G341800v2 [Setaria italica]|uniref:Knottins-like domain-containing protein n=1 Tax=Setaria italica TaxID=4555 RepID=A0A368QLR3_SETIT|nr:hypothetical protein SETIT_3G341800v2 [Setaria italica]
MVPSPRKNLSAAAAIVLLLIVMTAEMSCVEGNYCRHLSGKYHGWCIDDWHCSDTCIDEDKVHNLTGHCHDFPPRCYCVTHC